MQCRGLDRTSWFRQARGGKEKAVVAPRPEKKIGCA
jgi:hypothetical protein